MTHARGCEDGLYIFHSGTGRIHGPLKSCCISVFFRSVHAGEFVGFLFFVVFVFI